MTIKGDGSTEGDISMKITNWNLLDPASAYWRLPKVFPKAKVDSLTLILRNEDATS